MSPEGFPSYLYLSRSSDLLEQALKEWGSGSDFDLALRLQYEEMRQMQEATTLSSPTSAAARGRAATLANNNRSPATNSARPNSSVVVPSGHPSRRYGQKTGSSVTTTTDRASDEDKVSGQRIFLLSYLSPNWLQTVIHLDRLPCVLEVDKQTKNEMWSHPCKLYQRESVLYILPPLSQLTTPNVLLLR